MDVIQHAIEEIGADVARLRIGFVNVYFVGRPSAGRSDPGGGSWVLIDTGLAIGAARILDVAAARFGETSRPAAIVLTHAHFDHVGALEALLHVWDVPVYAHPLELPFLSGRADYPPPDPTVGGGLAPRLGPPVPHRGIDLGDRVKALPPNRTVPGMPGWRWLHTPGHSPGHVSFYRESSRLLIAGDALTTTTQELLFSVGTQQQELHGPPAYFTIDWERARRSVVALAGLQPAALAGGHGEPMNGTSVGRELAALAREFDRRERPKRGRYVDQPVSIGEDGVVALRPAVRSGGVRWGALSGVAAGAVAATWLYRRFGRKRSE
jgi:glyoxylase-like metal-dependent hydrolase (beta-lactamase superfamily II)